MTDVVRVTNFGEQPLTLRVSAHDAFNTAVGGFDVLPSDSASVDVGTWVTLAADEVVVPGRESVDVPFRLTVPSNASPGDHAGGIVASRSVPTTTADGTELLVEHRVGARVYVRVAGPVRPGLVVTEFEMRFEPEGLLGIGGAAVTTYTVRNSGNIRLAAEQMLAVDGPFGVGRRTVELDDLPELLPGGEYTASVTIDDVRAYGRVSSMLTLETSTTPPDVIEADAAAWAVPWRAVGVAALVVAWFVWRRRRRGAQPPGAADTTDGAAAGAPDATSATTVSAIAVLALMLPMVPVDASSQVDTTSQVVRIEPDVAAVGDAVAVTLEGWPPGPAQVELCGNGAQRGSVDCSRLGAVATAVGQDGFGTTSLPIGRPPSDCPCVVRVSQVHSGAAATVPIEVVGLAPGDGVDGRPSDAPSRRLGVTTGEVVADEGLGAWFGTDAGRRATLAVRNEGSVRLAAVTVSARLTGGLDTSVVIGSPPPFDLEPGEQRELTLAFELPAPAVGDYRIEGRVDGADEPVTFSMTTSHTPWGLINSILLLVAACAVLAARRRRRRAHPKPSPPEPVPTPPVPPSNQPAGVLAQPDATETTEANGAAERHGIESRSGEPHRATCRS